MTTTQITQATATVVVLTPAIIGPTVARIVNLDAEVVSLDGLRDLAPEIRTFDCCEGTDGLDLWTDDEALYSHWPIVNLAASTLSGGRIIGRAVVTGWRADDGAAIGLTPHQLRAVAAAVAIHRGPHFTD